MYANYTLLTQHYIGRVHATDGHAIWILGMYCFSWLIFHVDRNFVSSSDEGIRLVDNFVLKGPASLISILARERFYHFYGQPGARLEADMSVYVQQEDYGDHSHILHFLDMLLCFALTSHVQELKFIWVDDFINYTHWSTFTSNLTARWDSLAIYVGFLGIL